MALLKAKRTQLTLMQKIEIVSPLTVQNFFRKGKFVTHASEVDIAEDYTIHTLRVERTRTIKRIKSKEIFA